MEGINLIKKSGKNEVKWVGGRIANLKIFNPELEEDEQIEQLISRSKQQAAGSVIPGLSSN